MREYQFIQGSAHLTVALISSINPRAPIHRSRKEWAGIDSYVPSTGGAYLARQ
jgi:hypothetical protein